MLAINHVSNVSGYIVPLKELITIAHTHNMLVIVDAAQSVPHMPVNVQELDADFLAFSAHKLCGPTGVGVLYGKQDLLERYDPVFGGGSMISTVDSEYFTHADLPLKFEPGTPNVAGVIGFGAALTYLTSIGMEKIQRATHDVYTYAYEQLRTLPEIKKIYGPIDPSVRSSIIAFNVHETHPHDLAAILDADHQVAVRAGHHCAQPLATYWKVPATVRASFYFYNTKEDVDRLVTGIQKAQAIFRT